MDKEDTGMRRSISPSSSLKHLTMAEVMQHNVTFQSFKLDAYRTHIDNSTGMAMAEAIKDNAIFQSFALGVACTPIDN